MAKLQRLEKRMTADRVFAERSADAARANLRLYIDWADLLLTILDGPDYRYDRVKAVRNELTHWMPSVITMPVWTLVHGDLDQTRRGEAVAQLREARSAFTDILAGKALASVPAIFGDVSADLKLLQPAR
jgi:hypothetical protein